MITKNHWGMFTERKVAKTSLFASFAGLVVFALAYVLVPYIVAEARATTADATVNWSAVSVTLDPDYGVAEGAENRGDVIFGGSAGIHPTVNDGTNLGTMVVIKKTIGITTEGKYYRVFLSTSGRNKANTAYTSSLLHTASDTDLAIPAVGDDSSTTGTWDNPVAFTDAGWGFAVPNSPISKSGSTTARTDFTQSSTFSDTTKLGVELNATDNAAIYNQNLWAAVPIYGEAQEIWKAKAEGQDSSKGFSDGDQFDVYYGVMVDTDVLAGTYENNLVYTAIASTDALDAASNNISRSTKLVGEGTAETLIFDLTASTEGLIKKDDVHVYLVPHSIIHTANYKVTQTVLDYINYDADNKAQIELGNITANNAEIPSSNITSFDPTETGATLELTMPEKVPAGNLKSGDTNGLYDFVVRIPKYGYDYVSKYSDTTSDVASVVYAGLQSKDASGNAYITTMQEMTASVCKNTNKWGNTLGTAARVYDYTGAGTALASTMNDSMEIGIGTFVLTDQRDSKDYLVRRLADGNCWMVQNLDLDISQYNAQNPMPASLSDMTEDWDPYASTNEKIDTTYAEFLSATSLSSSFQGMMEWLNGNNTQTQQYQNSTQYSGNWYWGVKRTANDTIGSSVVNNAFSEIPRTYDNTVNGTNNVRYVAMDNSTGETYKTVNVSDPSGSEWVGGMTSNNGTVATTTESSIFQVERGTSMAHSI